MNGEIYIIDPIIQRRGGKIKLIKSIGEYLPIKNAFFNIIITTNTLDHTSNPMLVLREINRVLKKGGRLIISVNTFGFINKFHRIIKEKIGTRDVSHPHSFTRKDVERMLHVTGFNIMGSKPIPRVEERVLTMSLIYVKLFNIIDRIIDERVKSSSNDILWICKKEA